MSQAHEHHPHGEHGHGSPFIQHHYDDAKHQFESGKLGIWFFLTQEILFFSALFVAYILYRHHRPDIFAYAHHYLDTKWGAINTGVLILSSLSAAWSVRCAQLNQQRGLILCIVVTLACACGFLGIKYIEYSHKIHEGILFGHKFDPCISPSDEPLVTKKNKCPGVKTTIVWDFGAGKPLAGCFEGSFDRDLAMPGIQGECTVSEVKVAYSGGKAIEQSSRTLPACQFGESSEHGEHGGHGGSHHGPANPPCWQLALNPHVCPKGPAVMVRYGDHAVRGRDIAIKASCEAAPPPLPAAGDPFAERTSEPGLGQGLVKPSQRPTKHELEMEMIQGPPPANTNMFFSIYFAMTGLHGIHVLAGIFVYIWLLRRALRGDFTPDYFGPVDYAALYWHLVDLIWIFLFPLLYLIH